MPDRPDIPERFAVDQEHYVSRPLYGGSVPGHMFALFVFRCPSCGSTGEADSWCEGHSAPLAHPDASLRVKREPVLVPHADPDRSTTEIVPRDKERPPMPSPDIPEEAVGLAAETLCTQLPDDLELRGPAWIEDPLADEWGEWALPVLEAAAPAIRAQGAEEERERLRGISASSEPEGK